MEELKSAMEGMDIGALIPSLDTLLGKLELLLRLLTMVGPLTILGLGLYYFLLPPKEANYLAGYRFRYGMSRVAVWQFMQRVAGMAYTLLGLVLTVVMAILCTRMGAKAAPDMVWFAGKCILWEIGLAAVVSLAVNLTVVIVYDSQGNRRSDMKEEYEE